MLACTRSLWKVKVNTDITFMVPFDFISIMKPVHDLIFILFLKNFDFISIKRPVHYPNFIKIKIRSLKIINTAYKILKHDNMF